MGTFTVDVWTMKTIDYLHGHVILLFSVDFKSSLTILLFCFGTVWIVNQNPTSEPCSHSLMRNELHLSTAATK